MPVVVAGGLAAVALLVVLDTIRMHGQLSRMLADLTSRESQVTAAERQVEVVLEELAGTSAEEARRRVQARAVQRSKDYVAEISSIAEREATSEATSRARWIIAAALARVSQTVDRMEYRTTVALPSEVHGLRARLVGRDGRNLAAFAEVTGVQLSLREGRPLAVLTSFDGERRAIAQEVLSALIREPRVYESTIREVYEAVTDRWPSRLAALAREAAAAANAGELNDGLAHLMGRLHYRRVDQLSVLGQAITGAQLAGALAAEIGWPDPAMVARAAFLRDLGYAAEHDVGSHAEAGAVIAAGEGEPVEICQAIRQHHLFSIAHGDVVSSLVACAERLVLAGTEAPYEPPKLGLLRLQAVESALERIPGVTSARVLGLANEVSVWVDPETVADSTLQELCLRAVEVVRDMVARPVALTVHRHMALQVNPDGSALPIRWPIAPRRDSDAAG